MKRTKILALAAVMAAGISAPAMADYVRLGSVDVSYRTDSDTAYSRFGGRMEGLRLTADRSDVLCQRIRVNYADGSREEVFTGALREDRPVNVDLRGGARRVNSIDFRCRSDEFRGGKIYIMAEVGRYRDEWRSSPDWVRLWAGILGGLDTRDRGDRWDDRHNDWVTLGRESFDGRRDTETSYTNWRGRSVDRIALRPVDNDARCSRITVQFGRGRARDIAIDPRERLRQGQVKVLDLPGGDRNIRALNLSCRADRGRHVTIEILARR